MADYHERIKSAHGLAVEIKGDIEVLERLAQHTTQHRDFSVAISKAKLTARALIEETSTVEPIPGARDLFLEVI